ncbi:hypothetical protein WA588_001411 [Blastocystis sp. NMH]
MDIVFGFVGKDFALVCASSSVQPSIVTLTQTEDRIVEVSRTKILGCSGENGDRKQLGDYLVANFNLYKFRNERETDMDATAHSFRNSLAYFLRRQPYQVNLILGGVDGEVPSIYFIDYLGTLKKMDYCAHGYPSYILLSLFDRLWKRNMTREEAVELANRCMDEMKNRFPMNEHHYITKIVVALFVG